MTYLTPLARNDARLILRDPLLLGLLAMVLLVGAAARLALPAIDAGLAEAGLMTGADGGQRFSDSFPVFVTFIALWQAALIPGTVFGFLLIDEKEDQTLQAMRVTPVPLGTFLGYRVALPTLLGFVFGVASVPLIGISAVPLWAVVPMAAAASLTAPVVALLMAALADNKVQGLAYTKITGVAGLVLLIGWFVPEPWQWLLGVFPPFLVHKAYWMLLSHQPLWWAALLAGALAQAGAAALVLARFRRAAGF